MLRYTYIGCLLSHKVVKLARVWQLKIVPAAGENSIVTVGVKWGLLFDFFAQSNHERRDSLHFIVQEQSLWLIVRSNETGNEHKTVVYWRVLELLGQQLSSSAWIPHRDVPFLTLVRERPAAGNGQSASASFGDVWEWMNYWIKRVISRVCTHVFRRLRRIAKNDY